MGRKPWLSDIDPIAELELRVAALNAEVARLTEERERLNERGQILWWEAVSISCQMAEWRTDYWLARERLRNYGLTIEDLERKCDRQREDIRRLVGLLRRDALRAHRWSVQDTCRNQRFDTCPTVTCKETAVLLAEMKGRYDA